MSYLERQMHNLLQGDMTQTDMMSKRPDMQSACIGHFLETLLGKSCDMFCHCLAGLFAHHHKTTGPALVLHQSPTAALTSMLLRLFMCLASKKIPWRTHVMMMSMMKEMLSKSVRAELAWLYEEQYGVCSGLPTAPSLFWSSHTVQWTRQ